MAQWHWPDPGWEERGAQNWNKSWGTCDKKDQDAGGEEHKKNAWGEEHTENNCDWQKKEQEAEEGTAEEDAHGGEAFEDKGQLVVLSFPDYLHFSLLLFQI